MLAIGEREKRVQSKETRSQDDAKTVSSLEGGRLAGPVGGIFGNPNDLAANMVTFLPPAIVVAMSARHSAMKRGLAAAIVVMMAATIVFTKSRGGMLGAIAAIVALALAGRGTIRRGFGTMVVIGAILSTPFLPQSRYWASKQGYGVLEDGKDESIHGQAGGGRRAGR